MENSNYFKKNNFSQEDSALDSLLNTFLVIQNKKTNQVIGRPENYIQQGNYIFFPINLENEADIPEQQFVLYHLDNKSYYIVTRNNTIIRGYTVGPPLIAITKEREDFPAHPEYGPLDNNGQWLIIPKDSYYQIQNVTTGEIIVPGIKGVSNNYLGIEQDQTGDLNQLWDLKPIGKPFYNLKSPLLETLETFPKYKSLTDNLPDETPKRLTGWIKVPCVMVNDHSVNHSIKISLAPYYVIEKYQYWKKVETVSLAPGESREVTYTTGTNTTIMDSMDSSTSMTIGKDAGLKFEVAQRGSSFGGTADLKQTITNGLDIKESTTTDTMTESRETNTQRNPFDKQSMIFSVYQRATELRYIRPSQNEYDPDILINSWTFIDDTKSNITSFPSQEAISAELNKKRNQSHINPSSNVYLNF